MAFTIAPERIPLSVDAHGVVRVGGTRVTLDTVMEAFLEGASAEDIVSRYPSLDLADVLRDDHLLSEASIRGGGVPGGAWKRPRKCVSGSSAFVLRMD